MADRVIKGIRKVWKINPSIRIKQSKKIYNRNKIKQQLIKELKQNG